MLLCCPFCKFARRYSDCEYRPVYCEDYNKHMLAKPFTVESEPLPMHLPSMLSASRSWHLIACTQLHTADADRTRYSLVLSVSAVLTSYKAPCLPLHLFFFLSRLFHTIFCSWLSTSQFRETLSPSSNAVRKWRQTWTCLLAKYKMLSDICMCHH